MDVPVPLLPKQNKNDRVRIDTAATPRSVSDYNRRCAEFCSVSIC